MNNTAVDEDKFVVNEPVGDTELGTPFLIMPPNDKIYITELQTWAGYVPGGRWAVVGVCVIYSDETTHSQGRTSNAPYHRIFLQEDDKISTFDLQAGNRIDHVSVKILRGKKLDEGGNGGTPHKVAIGNGIIVGFRGSATDGEALYSLGPIFRK